MRTIPSVSLARLVPLSLGILDHLYQVLETLHELLSVFTRSSHLSSLTGLQVESLASLVSHDPVGSHYSSQPLESRSGIPREYIHRPSGLDPSKLRMQSRLSRRLHHRRERRIFSGQAIGLFCPLEQTQSGKIYNLLRSHSRL